MSTTYVERCLNQCKSHTKHLSNGDFVVGLPGGVYDLFFGDGWKDRVRFRIRKVSVIGSTVTKFEQLSGLRLSDNLQQMILKEVG